jgi:hypothetical protein
MPCLDLDKGSENTTVSFQTVLSVLDLFSWRWICTGWSKSLCAPDDYNTESYKSCSKCSSPVSRHLLTRRTVFSKTVFSIARSTFRMYSVVAIVRCTEAFWSSCISTGDNACKILNVKTGWGNTPWISYEVGWNASRYIIILLENKVSGCLSSFDRSFDATGGL